MVVVCSALLDAVIGKLGPACCRVDDGQCRHSGRIANYRSSGRAGHDAVWRRGVGGVKGDDRTGRRAAFRQRAFAVRRLAVKRS